MSADTPDVPGCRAYFKDVCPPCLSERTGGGRCDTPDVGLTEQERQSLIDAMDAVIEAGWTGLTPQHVGPVVERIVAARCERADAAALLALAAEIADGRVQRPGMQRRRQWADRIRAALGGEATHNSTEGEGT